MNLPLLTIGLRAHSRSALSYGFGSAAYVLLLAWLYPSIAAAPGLTSLYRSLPHGLLAALGLGAGLGSMGAYLGGEFLSSLFLWILMIYTVTGVVQLINQGVSRGTAGPFLAAPVSRPAWVWSQGGVFLAGLLLTCLAVAVAGALGHHLWAPRAPFPLLRWEIATALAFLLFAALSGLVALLAAWLPDDRRALGSAGTVVTVLYAANVIGSLSPKLAWLSHLTPFHLYRPAAIMSGPLQVEGTALALAAAALVLWAAAALVFSRRDLLL